MWNNLRFFKGLTSELQFNQVNGIWEGSIYLPVVYTQLYDTEMKAPDVNEGDIVMFPSMTPHRAPKVENDIRKTIVSFNFNVLKIHENKLREFKNA